MLALGKIDVARPGTSIVFCGAIHGVDAAEVFYAGRSIGFVSTDTLDPLPIYGPPLSSEMLRARHVNDLHERADKHPAHKGKCYFIGGETGPIKIGFSVNVKERLSTIQSHSPISVRILATAPGAELRECAYHTQFKEHRLHGEWFERHPSILAEIDRLHAKLRRTVCNG